MAGSNGSPAQRGGTPPHWPAESEEQARALELERWRHQQAQLAQQGYPQSQPQQGYQQPALDYGQPSPFDIDPFGHQPQQGGYSHPHGAESNAHPTRNPFEPPYADSTPHPQGQFEPHFDRFAPAAPHAQDYPSSFDPHQLPAGGYDQVQDPFNPRRVQPPFELPQGFDPNQGYGVPHGHSNPGHRQDAHSGHSDGRGDLQSWDLSNYHPGQIPQGYQNQPALHDPHAQLEWGTPAPGAQDQQWSHAPGQENWGPEAVLPQGQHYDPNAPAQFQQHYQLDPGYEPGDPNLEAGLEPDEYDAPEEPRRGPSVVLVVSMLVGAIIVGGGLAFAYKHLSGSGHSATVAEIKRQTTPEKVRPQDPGGKTIEHSDSAFLNRASTSVASGESRQSDVDGSAKKVSTIPIVVNRDGSLTPQSSNDSIAPSDTSGVPGLVLDGLGPPPVPPQLRPGVGQAPAETPPPQSQASRLPPPPPPVVRTPPRVADLPLPKVINTPPPVTAAVEQPVPPPVRKPPRVSERDDFVAHRATASGVGAAGIEAPRRTPTHAVSKSGFVAVLASKRSRQEALNTFADLHSQYPEILGTVTPDVREANLGAKGTWYRLIGGPPGSREAAHNICVKLKARGMKDCWPVAY